MVNIEQLRKKIQQADANLIELLAERQALSKQIGQLKRTQGKEIVDPLQEEKLFIFYELLAKHYNLPKTFVHQVFKTIITHSRKIQTQSVP